MTDDRITRREATSRVLAASVSTTALYYLTGCPNGPGTGVFGLNTPNQILANPFVNGALEQARGEGLGFRLYDYNDVDPPVLSGRYSISGRQEFPDSGPLYPGTLTWSNQTADNHIDTDYEQLTQTGTSIEGEIIRGVGNRFTVYSIMRITDGTCTQRTVFIVDGRQGNNGSVSVSYLSTPVSRLACFTL